MRKGTGLAALIVLVASLLGPVIGAEPAMAAGATRKLTITKQSLAAAPGGTGTVTSSATGTTAPINCGSLCSTTYARSTVVTVTATPSADSTFASFSTNCAPVAGSSPAACTLTLANDTTVTVTFAKKQTLTVAKTNGDGNGKGSIAGATTCDATAVTAGTCATTLIAYNTNAVLTATADANSVFKGWTGCTSVSGSQCTVLMSAAKTVTAAFQARYALTVSATPLGTGSGTVTVGGVACSLPCSPTFESGTIVTIAASPGASSVLNGISGACTGATSCAVTVNAAKSASVTFASLEPVVAAVVGAGSVTSTPAGITDCASSCSASFPFGSSLTLVASSPESSRFSGWSGACATWGTTPTCVVTVASGMTATANFGALDHLIVEKSSTGGGSGTVTATTEAAGTVVDCGSDCGEWLDPGTVVTLSAVAAPSSRFVGWGGSCASAGSAADCTLTMAGTSTVTAAFIARWTFDLTATSQGVWGGEVTWSDVTCRAATCSRIYDHDTIVTLTATPDADAFVTWGGACASYGSATSCTVTVDQARSVTADFTRILHHLAVTKPGTGLGTVTSTIGEANGPIDCGSTCDADVGTKTIVVLTATPTAGSRFGSWTGPCAETDKTGLTCTVDLSTDVDVSADFILLPVLTVDPTFIAGATGTVTSSPGSISCPGTCDTFYDAGTSVTLTATPGAPSVTVSWTGGGCTGFATTCGPLTIDAARTVTVTFTKVFYPLTVTRSGSGSALGSVTSTVGGSAGPIDCGATCSAQVEATTSVVLTEVHDASTARFGGWSGACSGSNATCTVTMNAAKSVTASFVAIFLLTVSATDSVVDGTTYSGTVTTTAGIDCPTTSCSRYYDAGTPVTITARPATGSMVASWSIVNCGRATTCQVTMSQAQTVGVTFTKLMYLLTVNRSLLGTGSGSVAGNGIDCPLGACAVWLDPATSVTLTQAAAAGSAFTGWSGGGCGGSGATCSFTIGVDTTVTATFASLENVTIAKAGLATGTVTSNVGGIACDQTCTSQTVQIPYGTPVTLSQAPFGTALFIGWSIGTCGATCPFTVTGARTVTATFDPPKYTVTVTTASVDSGAGTISSNPTGVVCLSPCKSTYAGSFYENTPVTLTAAPASGSYVVGWTGGCVSSTASCTVTMSEAKNVTATFGKPVLRVTKLSYAAGAGSITATYQSGNRTVTLFSCTTKQNCTTTSGTAPTVGQTVTVTVNPDTGSAFTGWGGDCATFGAATTCTLVMDTAKTITAAFGKPIPVDVALTGAGSVAISWAGGSQACSSTCSLTVTAGSTVTFVATASVGYAFLQWSGSCATAGTATTCVLDTLTTSASVTAEFGLLRSPPPA